MGEIFKTKEEYVLFLIYLREKENPVIDHIRRFGGLSRGVIDQGEIAEEILGRLRNYVNEEIAYKKMAMRRYEFRGSRELRKKYNFIFYREELAEYLRSLGIENDKANQLAECIGKGQYKEYCRSCKKNETLKAFGDIHDFGLAIGFIETWDYLAMYFPTEVEKFKELRKEYFRSIIDGVFHSKYLYVKHQEEKGWRGIADRILTLVNDICCKLEIKRYKCPVCGKKTLSSRGSFEICSECGWEDEGIDDDDEEPVFGPNGDYTIREYREEYLKLKKKDPKYRWCKSFSEDD